MKAADRLIPRHPLAWGMTKWGPVPGTRDTWVLWDGPGAGLYSHATDPAKPGSQGMRIRHPAAAAEYATLAEAEAAVMAFVRIYLDGEEAGR